MKVSTANALKRAMNLCVANNVELKEPGLRHHTERTWIGLCENDDIVLVEIPVGYRRNEEDVHVFLYSTKGSKELNDVVKAVNTNQSS